MQTTTHSVIGIFQDHTTAERVKRELIASGFQEREIEIQSRDDYAREVGSGGTGLSGRTDDYSGGGIGGFFRRLFGSDDDTYSTHYSNAISYGHPVVCVNTSDDNRQDIAADIMNRNGAIDVDERASSWASNTTDRDTFRSNDTTERSVPVVREDLQVSKRLVNRGGVRIVNRVIEEPVEEDVTLREEHVRVDRRSVDRPATARDLDRADEVIEVTEMAEEPVVGKRTRVVEEIGVSKDTTERTEKIRDTVRRTDVDIQNLDSSYDDDFRRHYQTRFGSAADYDTYAPAYQYGYRMASDDRYRGRRWEDIEPDLRTNYERNYPGSTWDKMKDSIRYGWERMNAK